MVKRARFLIDLPQNVNKNITSFFFNFEILKQPCEYQKTVKFDWNKTSEQGYIGQKQFQLDCVQVVHDGRREQFLTKKITKTLTW